MSDDRSVRDLVTCARNDDKRAWDDLVKRYAPLVWSICRSLELTATAAAEFTARGETSPAELSPRRQCPCHAAGRNNDGRWPSLPPGIDTNRSVCQRRSPS